MPGFVARTVRWCDGVIGPWGEQRLGGCRPDNNVFEAWGLLVKRKQLLFM